MPGPILESAIPVMSGYIYVYNNHSSTRSYPQLHSQDIYHDSTSGHFHKSRCSLNHSNHSCTNRCKYDLGYAIYTVEFIQLKEKLKFFVGPDCLANRFFGAWNSSGVKILVVARDHPCAEVVKKSIRIQLFFW